MTEDISWRTCHVLVSQNPLLYFTYTPNETQDGRGVFESLLRGIHVLVFHIFYSDLGVASSPYTSSRITSISSTSFNAELVERRFHCASLLSFALAASD